MKTVQPYGETREGKESFEEIDIENYTRRVFSMFGGTDVFVTIQLDNSLLDTAVDRFGLQNVTYRRIDKEHFTVSTHVETSNKFFAWVCGFGKKAKIISPPEVVEDFKMFLNTIQKIYQT